MGVGVKLSDRRPAVFLDRDGVLNVEKGYICLAKELELYDFAKKSVALIHKKGYYAIVISNQSGVARGLLSESDLQKINAILIDKTGVDEVFYCPHYEQGKIERYSISCDCRKPKIGLIQRAEKKYQIDIERSYIVGDRASDIQTGKNAGMKTVLVKTGYGKKGLEFGITPDYIYDNLFEFAVKLPDAKK